MRSSLPVALRLLGALLVVYLGYPIGAFLYRVASGTNEGWAAPGLWPALGVSAEGATITLVVGVLTGVPLAYILAHRRGWASTVIGTLVQLPLAVPPLMSGVLLIYILGPYTFLGQMSGQRLTQTMIGVIIAQSFVSIPFLVVVARSAFRAVDSSLADVAATLGHRPFARFARVHVPAAADGIRAGMILLWLRAFGEYGAVVILAYHPYSLPVYVANVFSSAPLSQAEAPTLLALTVAALAIALGQLRVRPRRARRVSVAPALTPVSVGPTLAVGFDLNTTVGSFKLSVTHPAGSHRLAILGPSGAGKSMTLRAIAGLLDGDVGSVRFGTEEVGDSPAEQRGLGYVPQGFGLLPGKTVWEQVMFGVNADPVRAAWWLGKLGLEELAARRPEQLSGGQRQRVSLARALAVGPALLLLDEPFSGLDAPVRSQLRRELRRLQRDANLSTIIVTHDPEEAALLADEVIVISEGRVLQSGPCREVYQRPASVQVGRLLGIDNLFEGAPDVAPADAGLGRPSLWHLPPESVVVKAHADEPDQSMSLLGGGVVLDIIDLGRVYEVVVELSAALLVRARMTQVDGLAVGMGCRVETVPGALSTWQRPAADPAGSTPL
ncbi:MAG: ATP-binding cassette domain-containing protein [Solirubrobacteraceae bacterium]